MPSLPKQRYTPEQYLEIERASSHKSEYISGEMFAMAGGTVQHSIITVNTSSKFAEQLANRPCVTLSSDTRVMVKPTGLFTYPDVSVVCGDIAFFDNRNDTILNPVVIVEVLSPSTEAYDRGDKFAHYQYLESLKYYILISQDKMRVEIFTRQHSNQWLLNTITEADDYIILDSISCRIKLSEIYHKVDFSPVVNETNL